MIKDTLEKIDKRLSDTKAVGEENRRELQELMAELKTEISTLCETDREQAESITSFADLSTREAMRRQKDPELVKLSLLGFVSSVRELESTHPNLVQTVNTICSMLANLGI
ncbi:MAG: DUF4404 family protein [Smithellaceae bacterium]|nr:DUF4404 family protein [Smithellaceae bacterium]